MNPEPNYKKGRIQYYTATIERLTELELKRDLTEKESDQLDRVTKFLANELDAK